LPRVDPASRPLVLVCDDESGPRISLEAILGDTCTLVLTDSPAAALAEVKVRQFDCAVIDWSMPGPTESVGHDGNEEAGARLIRDLTAADRSLAVIVWTAHGERMTEVAQQLSAFCTMPKPVDPDVVADRVLAAIAVTRSRRTVV
jgi:DNA-binding NtrC family response regulator